MDFETFKKTKLESVGVCPKCQKHFNKLRTHANACIKNEYDKFLSLPNVNNSIIKESKSIQDFKSIQELEKKIQSTTDLQSVKSTNLKKTKSNDEITIKPTETKTIDGIVSKIKIQEKPPIDKMEQIKFQEFYETVIQKLKNQTLTDTSCQYRFDFLKLRCDVKPILPKVELKNSEKISQEPDKFSRKDLYENSSSSYKTTKITPVLLVTNFDPDSVKIEALFILFGVYGDVQRIKLIDKKIGFIEFTNKEQAETAMSNLNNCKIWGKELKVYACPHETITSSSRNDDRNCYSKEYTNSHLHRFKYRKPDSPNYINRPSATLYLSNVPQDINKNDLIYLFERYGKVVAIRFTNRNSAIIQMGSVEEGVMALINNHGKQLNKNLHLRCNFHNRNISSS